MKMKRINVSIAVLAMLFFLGVQAACAENDFIVYSPYVVQGQSEVETFGYVSQDSRSNLNGAGGANFSAAHTFTSWWKTEVYFAQLNRAPGGSTHPSGYEFENTFQLTDPGELWVDVGFLASYANNTQPGMPNGVEFGPLLEKLSGHIDQRLNLIFGKQLGGQASGTYQFRSAYSIRYNIDYARTRFAPGIEFYYRPNDNAYQVGPVLYGELRTDAGREFDYSVGIVFGTNQGAPAKTLLARLEYEFF